MEPKFEIRLDTLDFNDEHLQAYLDHYEIKAELVATQDNGIAEYAYYGTLSELRDLVHEEFANDEEEFVFLMSTVVQI